MMFAYRRVNTSTLVKGLGTGDLMLPGIWDRNSDSEIPRGSPCGNRERESHPKQIFYHFVSSHAQQKSAYWSTAWWFQT